jgi:TP901 family phage tail tape measure protein
MDDIEVAGVVAKISLDDTGIPKSMAELTRQMKLVESQFKTASAQLSNFGDKEGMLRSASDSLTKQIGLQEQKVSRLREAYQKSAADKGEDARQTQRLAIDLNRATAELAGMESRLRDTNAEIRLQASSWTTLENSLNSAGEKLQNVGSKMGDIGVALTKTVTAPIVAVGGLATKFAVDFESAFAGVRKTVDGTEQDFAQLETGIRDMSKQIPVAASEIAKVAESAGQLGIQKQAILGFTRTMEDLGVATDLTADQAATALARLANITKMPQEQFDRLGSTVVALGNAGASTESEIVAMGLRIAGAGNQIGLSEPQILSFASALSSVGIEAEAGGSSISRVMIEIATAVEEGGKQLQLFASVSGTSTAQFQKQFREDAAGAVVSFIEGLGKMQKAGQSTFGVLDALKLSEIQVRDALLRASGAGDLFRKSLETGSKAWAENTALTKEAEQRYKTTASQMQIFRNRLTDIGITLGQAIIPALLKTMDALQPLIDLLAKMAKWFSGLGSGMQSAIIATVAFTAALGPAMIIMGSMIRSTGVVVSAFGSLAGVVARAGGVMVIATTAVRGLGAALMFLVANPVGIAITAVAALVAGIVVLYKVMSKDSIPAVQRFGDQSQAAMSQASGSFAKFRDGAKSALQDTSKAAKYEGGNIAKNLVDKIGGGAKKAKDTASENLRALVDEMKATVDRSADTLNKLGDALVAALKSQYTAMQKNQEDALSQKVQSEKKASDAVLKQYDKELDEKLKSLDKQSDAEKKASDDRLKIYDREYAEKLKYIDEDTYRQVKALQDQIDGIDSQTAAEEKAAKEQEYQVKIAELSKQLAAAETADERLRIQQDLMKTTADHERQALLDQRKIQTQSLKDQMDAMKTAADKQKDQLKQELDDRKSAESDKLQALEVGLSSQKDSIKTHYDELELQEKDRLDTELTALDRQKEAISAHWDALTKDESLRAEARLLIVQKNNDEIIRLLKTYNPQWQDAGQSFADAFEHGLNSQKQSMKNAVAAAVNIAPLIDDQVRELESLQNKLKEIEAAASAAGGAGGGGVGDLTAGLGGASLEAVGLTDALNNGLGPALATVGENADEGAQQAVDAFLGLRNKATVELNGLYWSGTKVTQNTAASIADTFFAMGQQIGDDLKESHARQLKAMEDFFANTKTLTNAEKAVALKKVKESMADEAKSVEEGQIRVAEILSKALDEKRGLTQKEYDEITTIQQKMSDEGIKILSGGATQQKVILEKLKKEASDLSAQQAAEVVRNSIKQRDGSVQSAEEQYDQSIAEIIKLRDESKTITKDQADKLILEAQRQRDETVAAAEDMHHKVVEQAKQQADGQTEKIDWGTGEILTKWSVFKNKFLKEVKDTWNDSVDSTKTSLGLMRDGASEKFQAMGTAIGEKFSEIKSSISKKWDEIMVFFKSINLKDIGENIIKGLIDGLESKWNELKQKASDIGDSIATTLRGVLKVKSPSQVTMEIGRYAGEGLVSGMQDTLTNIRRQASAMAAAAMPAIGSATQIGSRVAAMASTSTASQVINFERMFDGATINLPNEANAKAFARELWGLATQNARGMGLV